MFQVHASIMAVLIQAALVTVAPSAEENCPSSAQVQAALETHAPRLVDPSSPASPSSEGGANGPLTLSLSPTLATGEMGLSLIDRAGLVRLYRVLPPPLGDRARDCAALADTVAFIIDRYFDEVELPQLPERKSPAQPPLLPPPPRIVEPTASPPKSALSVTMGRRVPGGAADLGGYEFKLTGGAALTTAVLAGGHPWIDLSAGIVGIANQRWRNGSESASAVRTGTDLAFLLGWPVWRGMLYAGPEATAEMIWLNWRDADAGGQVRREIRFASAAGLRTGYEYFWRQRFFARADLTGCIAILRQRIAAQSAKDVSLFESPPAYIVAAFGVGIWF
jgi:hypothetical protein